MSKNEIIGQMAKSRAVERCIESMIHQTLDFDLNDLSQMIYEALLEQPEERVQDLWNNGEMQFFVWGIAKRQLFSNTSPFYLIIKKFSAMTDDITECYELEDKLVLGNEGESSSESIQADNEGLCL